MKVLGFFLVALLSCSAIRAEEMEGNEIDDDQEGRSSRPGVTQDYDPSFLDEILGPDYFDEPPKNKEVKTKESVVVVDSTDNIEPVVVTEKAFCTGCDTEVDVTDPKINDIALFAFNTYASASDEGSAPEETAQTFVRVTKAKTQVVAGYKYKLTVEAGYMNCSRAYYSSNPTECALDPTKETFNCTFEVWEQAWANKKEVTHSECSDSRSGYEDEEVITESDDDVTDGPVAESRRKKREVVPEEGLLGDNHFGKLRAPEESEEFLREMSDFALQQLDQIDADNEARLLVDVLSVKKQTVSGWLYHLKLRVAQTSCEEGKGKTLEECRSKIQLPFNICQVKILVQPWQTMTKKVTESQCFPEKMKASKKLARQLFPDEKKFYKKDKKEMKERNSEVMVGAPKTLDPSSPEVTKIMDWAIESVDAQSNALHAQRLVKVIHAESQVVNGILKKVTFETGYTTCRKKSDLDRSQCSLDEERKHNFCEIHVWEKPWLDEKKVTYSKCGKREEILKRKKRSSLIGGDDHDLKPHSRQIGGDDHDFQPHARKIGGDDHDFQPHARKIGGDDHDLKPHGSQHMLGGDDHDRKSHTKKKFGGDDHDMKPHTRKIGGDDHDMKPHKRQLGGDDHDMKPHGSSGRKLGGDDHDMKPHGVGGSPRKFGGDDHDLKPHSLIGGGSHDYSDTTAATTSQHKIGGDDHDFQPHSRPLLGGGDHDYNGHEIAEFGKFLDEHNKKYDTPEEYKYRLGVFKDNMKKVKLLQENEQGTATYGATLFADLTEEEFAAHHLGLRRDLRQRSGKIKQAKIPQLRKLPNEFDWRNYSAVTPVKNQGTCGSCWAFSVTGNIEGLYARKHQTLESFSEQELVDCDTLDDGCGGGLPENAYKAIQKLGGLDTEADYPYDGRNEKCHFKSGVAKAQVTGFVEVSKNETEMAAWLVKNGPISIGINANAMQFYFGGVSHPFKFLCSPKSLDHGVLIVGYGVHNYPMFNRTLPFWTVKNSWGPHWGEQGYYRVYRGDGTCGVNQMATSAVIA